MHAFAFVALSLALHAPTDVPDPRPHHHVIDLTQTLTSDDVSSIDGAAERASSSGELMVVVVPSVDGAVPRAWTTELFNRFALDTGARNRGVLLMAALTDRKAEIVIGDGFPDGVTATTDSIMAGVVVANFKAGNPRKALVEGADAIAARVLAPAAPPPPAAVDPAVLIASESAAVQALPLPQPGKGAVDLAKALRPIDDNEVRIAREQAPGMALAVYVITKKHLGTLTTRDFARGLAHRLKLDGDRARDALVVVVTGKQPVLEIALGAGMPPGVVGPEVESEAARWRTLVAAKPALLGKTTGELARAISMTSMLLAQHDAEVARQAAAAREQQERQAAERRARLAEAARNAPPPESIGFFSSDNPVAWGTGAFGLAGGGLGLREILRRRPRSCRKCRVKMFRLAEDEDDKHLVDGERAEERLGSVDYDIWCCPQCNEVLKTRWGAIFTSYSRCSGCSWRTMSSTSRTIRSATTSSTGLAEVTESCSHCGRRHTYTRVIPRVQQSSSSSSSSSRSSGGGSSSGRGSSGSW